MAASVDSNPQARDPRGLSGVEELNLERSVLRRGLATPEEIEACKARRAKLAAVAPKDAPARGLLEIMIEEKVLTRGQASRLLHDGGVEPGKKFEIPGYQILERLGKGSMGLVFKAKQLSVDRLVAIKVLLDTLAQNKEYIKRFEREAKIAARLSHTNIVNAIDAGEVNGHYFFVMEYVEGMTIKDVLDRDEFYEEKEAIRIVMAVAEALKHAHERGLIHRDIKPENVILTKEGNVKLADLGLARLTDDYKWGLAEAGMAIGTPYYISPEQVRGQTNIDIRADIYSLGATLYHMVTGKVPYSGDTPNEVMKKHVDPNVAFVPPDHLNSNLSSGLGMVVETMMAKNRENRYSNPDDLMLDLKCLLRGESPMIAGQEAASLASLSAGESSEVERGLNENEMIEMAGYVNSRHAIIAILGGLLALSGISNFLLIVARR